MKEWLKVLLCLIACFALVYCSTLYIPPEPEIRQLQGQVEQLQAQVNQLSAEVKDNDDIVNRWIQIGGDK